MADLKDPVKPEDIEDKSDDNSEDNYLDKKQDKVVKPLEECFHSDDDDDGYRWRKGYVSWHLWCSGDDYYCYSDELVERDNPFIFNCGGSYPKSQKRGIDWLMARLRKLYATTVELKTGHLYGDGTTDAKMTGTTGMMKFTLPKELYDDSPTNRHNEIIWWFANVLIPFYAGRYASMMDERFSRKCEVFFDVEQMRFIMELFEKYAAPLLSTQIKAKFLFHLLRVGHNKMKPCKEQLGNMLTDLLLDWFAKEEQEQKRIDKYQQMRLAKKQQEELAEMQKVITDIFSYESDCFTDRRLLQNVNVQKFWDKWLHTRLQEAAVKKYGYWSAMSVLERLPANKTGKQFLLANLTMIADLFWQINNKKYITSKLIEFYGFMESIEKDTFYNKLPLDLQRELLWCGMKDSDGSNRFSDSILPKMLMRIPIDWTSAEWSLQTLAAILSCESFNRWHDHKDVVPEMFLQMFCGQLSYCNIPKKEEKIIANHNDMVKFVAKDGVEVVCSAAVMRAYSPECKALVKGHQGKRRRRVELKVSSKTLSTFIKAVNTGSHQVADWVLPDLLEYIDLALPCPNKTCPVWAVSTALSKQIDHKTFEPIARASVKHKLIGSLVMLTKYYLEHRRDLWDVWRENEEYPYFCFESLMSKAAREQQEEVPKQQEETED
jgi:hypothetical protein